MTQTLDEIRTFWNRRYGGEAYAYGETPNEFLVQCRPLLPAPGRVLCLGDGEGRNGVWLACQGLDVTSVDAAELGLAKAARLAATHGVALHTLQADVTTLDLGTAAWDAIVSIFMHLPAAERRALHARCITALRPGGVFIAEAYTPLQLQHGTGGPRDAELLVSLPDLEADFAGCAIEHRFSGVRRVVEGTLHTGDAHVAQLVARRT